jgi:hypothetical protein
MKARPGSVRGTGKAKPKAKAASRTSTLRKSAGAMARPAAREARPIEVRRREKVVVLLSGGNPQVAKADGDAPVVKQATALPGWSP